MDNLYMKDLIPKKYKHLLYRDEFPELCDFLILKYAEVYRYTKDTLRLLIFKAKYLSPVRKLGSNLDEWGTDDGLYILDIDNAKLGAIIALGATKRRINQKGKNIISLGDKLGHKIYPYNPYLERQKQSIRLTHTRRKEIPKKQR